MDKFYFAAKINQEHAGTIRKKALSLGVPEENIILSSEGCKVLHLDIYIKFNDKDTYSKFKAWDVPGLVERW